jgi:amino acid transporter
MPNTPGLVRSIGRWSLAALVLNGIIGSAVFALPGTVAARLGWLSLVGWLVALIVAVAIVLCFAEVSSRFREAGGIYLYAQAAFGRFVGLQMAWMAFLVRVLSAAVQINLLNVYLAEFWPPAATRGGSLLVSTVLVGVLAVINIRGVATGAGTSNVFAVAKLLPLLIFSALGVLWVFAGKTVAAPVPTVTSVGGWLQVLLLLMFAFGGFEAALLPLGEAKNPRRDAPFALLFGLGAVTIVYVLVQVTVLATLPDPGGSERPLAASARVLFGPAGAAFMTVAALTSVYGWLAGGMLNVPRLTMAMADRGDLPSLFGRIHPTFRTPWVSILVFALLVWLLSMQGDLLQNISLATVSRMFTYGLVCAALPVFRRWDARQPGRAAPALFQIPLGGLSAAIGVLVSVVLVLRMTGREALALGVTMLLALGHWVIVTRPARVAGGQ